MSEFQAEAKRPMVRAAKRTPACAVLKVRKALTDASKEATKGQPLKAERASHSRQQRFPVTIA